MARDVTFDDVRSRVSDFGDLATLVTVTDAGTPHSVTVLVEVGHDRLLASVGPRTRANLLAGPSVSLLWHPAAGGDYQLIVDGTAEIVGVEDAGGVTPISVAVTRGILHRLAGRDGAGPTCVALGPG